jgi:hypothetical protein
VFKRPKVRYIDNDPNLGIDYDWELIAKEYKKLGVPPEYDITEIIPLGNEAIKWYILTSERSVGKTTNVLLVGMVMINCTELLFSLSDITSTKHPIMKLCSIPSLHTTRGSISKP